jgi:hypothetical protein
LTFNFTLVDIESNKKLGLSYVAKTFNSTEVALFITVPEGGVYVETAFETETIAFNCVDDKAVPTTISLGFAHVIDGIFLTIIKVFSIIYVSEI